jgi:3-oxoacyl-[acyl-carrier-protein] synthase-3
VARSRIVGTGSYLPERVVTNHDICERLNRGPAAAATQRLDPEGIYRRTGIQVRRWAADDQASSDLAEGAARQALDAAGIPPSSIDAILVSTTSPDMVFPSTACHLQRHLGTRGPAAFDLSASCSGFLYGLSMADAFIRSGQYRRCLVLAAEIKSRSLDPEDEATAALFGDGAGAVVLTAETEEGAGTGAMGAGIVGIRLYTDGSRQALLQVPAGGSCEPASLKTVQEGRHAIRMRGGPLFRVAVKRLAEAVTDLLKEFGLRMEDVDQAIFHQANHRLLTALADRVGLPAEKLFTVIEQFGNTSSASLPIALDHAVRSGRIHPGDMVLLGAFGGGLTWGAGLVRW